MIQNHPSMGRYRDAFASKNNIRIKMLCNKSIVHSVLLIENTLMSYKIIRFPMLSWICFVAVSNNLGIIENLLDLRLFITRIGNT